MTDPIKQHPDDPLAALLSGAPVKPSGPKFALQQNRFHKTKAETKTSRRGIKRLIRPENAREVLPHLPTPGETCHCLLLGNFVLGAIIPAIVSEKGTAKSLRVATLSLSEYNAKSIIAMLDAGEIESARLLVSHYFSKVDEKGVFAKVAAILGDRVPMAVARSHCKIVILEMASGETYVIEGSANLRSSDNLEQMTIFNDRELAKFHTDWMDELSN